MKLLLSTGLQANNPALTAYTPTFQELIKKLSTPTVGAKDGDYFIRCGGTTRNNKDTSQMAYVLILDGDSRIDPDSGEIISGAPNPVEIHELLANLVGINHCIYTSHSNNLDLHKYRVILPCCYTREQFPALLDWIFPQLHRNGVMLAPVPENKTWSQAWYFPRVPSDRAHLFNFLQFSKGDNLDADAIHKDWVKNNAARAFAAEPVATNPQAITKPYAAGQIDPIALFNAHYQNPFSYLATQGYRVIGDRMLRPNSSSKTAGVQLCGECADGRPRVYSHGGDVLNDGYAHDSFGCFTLLEHGGNCTAALKAVGKMFLVGGVTVAKHNQVVFAKSKAVA